LEEGNSDFLMRVLAAGLRSVMEADVAEICQAAPGERTPVRENQRNG
jgi:transposase-like protein